MLYLKYKWVIRSIIGITAFLFLFVINVAYPYISTLDKTLANNTLLFIFKIASLYTIFFNVLLYLYENFFWKYIHPSYNYNGYWKMKITYQFLERESTQQNNESLKLPYTFESVFKIKQDIFDFHFLEGFSAPNEIWTDESLRVTDNGFNMSYTINRSDKTPYDNLPSVAIGYEKVTVTERNLIGNPIYMDGQMYHASLPSSPLYRGTTTYENITKSEYTDLLQKMRKNTI